jgi:hypothetical protein
MTLTSTPNLLGRPEAPPPPPPSVQVWGLRRRVRQVGLGEAYRRDEAGVCVSMAAPRPACSLKSAGLAQNLGQLYGSDRDFQSNCWANLRILGQPCEFYISYGRIHILCAAANAYAAVRRADASPDWCNGIGTWSCMKDCEGVDPDGSCRAHAEAGR